MKNVLRKALPVLSISLFVILLAIGCPNIQLGETASIPEGYGTFSLRIADSQQWDRTIMPATGIAQFALYRLTFSREGKDDIGPFDYTYDDLEESYVELPVDTYTLEVLAYTSEHNKDHNKPAAFYKDELDIAAGHNISEITLTAFGTSGSTYGGKGVFSWIINVSGVTELTQVKIEIDPIPDTETTGSKQDFILVAAGATTGQKLRTDSLELNAGYYRVIIELSKANMNPVKWRETLHVYENMTSPYSHPFTNDYFIKNFYTVTYDTAGGTPTPPSGSHFYDATYEPTAPAKTGYTFDGWFKDGQGSAWTFPLLNGELVLVAKWTPVNYSITYNLDGGTNHASNPANYNIETPTITLLAPTKSGQIFGGWFNDSIHTPPAVSSINIGSHGNLNLYAKWDINTDYEGAGTLLDPFIINSETRLRRVGQGTGAWEGNWSLGAYYKQTANIALAAPFTSIGAFTGNYDGGGFEITNLNVSLFSSIGSGGKVHDLGVSGNISGSFNVGGIAGTNNGTIEKCYFFKGSISGSANVGGIAGTNSSTIDNCYNDAGTITGSGYNTGGIAGSNNSGNVLHSYSTGNISGADNVGGIVGQNSGTGKVENCIALAAKVEGYDSVGRIAGDNRSTLTNNRARVDLNIGSARLPAGASGIGLTDIHGQSQNLNSQSLSTVFQGSVQWSSTIWYFPNNNLAEEDYLPRLTASNLPKLPRGIRHWENFNGSENANSLNFNSHALVDYNYSANADTQRGWYLKQVFGTWVNTGKMINEEKAIEVRYTGTSTISNSDFSGNTQTTRDYDLGVLGKFWVTGNISGATGGNSRYRLESVEFYIPHVSVELELYRNSVAPANRITLSPTMYSNFDAPNSVNTIVFQFTVIVQGQWSHDTGTPAPEHHLVFKDAAAEFYYWRNTLNNAPMSVYGEITSRDGFVNFDPVGRPTAARPTNLGGGTHPYIIIHSSDQFDYTEWVADTNTARMATLGLTGSGPDIRVTSGTLLAPPNTVTFLTEQSPHDIYIGTERIGSAIIEALDSSPYTVNTPTNTIVTFTGFNFKVTYTIDDPDILDFLVDNPITASARTTSSPTPVTGVMTAGALPDTYVATFSNLPFSWITIDTKVQFKP